MDSYDEVTCKVETDRTPDLESSLTQTNSWTGVLRLWTTVSVRPILSNNERSTTLWQGVEGRCVHMCVGQRPMFLGLLMDMLGH